MEDIKKTILSMVIKDLDDQIQRAEHARIEALDEAKAHKGAMESRYDTFKEEAQYLVGGYASQIRILSKKMEALTRIKSQPPVVIVGSVYSIVEVEDLQFGVIEKYFLLPSGSGKVYNIENESVKVLDIASPIARIFIGATPNKEVEMRIPSRPHKKFRVISVT